MDGEVQAICTAPLNKEALHAGGHVFPGHTELLAQLTGTEEVSMMLATPKVKVIHVTTHIGLIDAVDKIEPGLVERTVRRGHEALVEAGVTEPEDRRVRHQPARRRERPVRLRRGGGEDRPGCRGAAQADGIDARGPLPADTRSSSPGAATTTWSSRCTTTRATARSRCWASRRASTSPSACP